MRPTLSTKPPARWILRFLAALSLWGPACIGNHPKSCTQSGDCQPGGLCDGQGFCTHECRSNVDCPCGSSCNRSCGLCLRVDTGGLATCFAIDRNVSINEALGACRNPSPAPAPRDGAADAGPKAAEEATAALEGGACLPAPMTLTCGIDAGSLVPTADAGQSDDAGHAPDAIQMTDANSMGGGQ